MSIHTVHITGDGRVDPDDPDSPLPVAGVTANKELKTTLAGSVVPLPTGAATETTLASALAELVLILAKLNDVIKVTQVGVTTIAVPVELDAPIPAGTNSIGSVTVNTPSTFGNGKTTTNASTAVVIKSDTTIKGVTVKALTTNTGLVYVGDSSVSSANGFELQAGESVSIDIDNTNKVYFDVSVNGEGVTYAYVV